MISKEKEKFIVGNDIVIVVNEVDLLIKLRRLFKSWFEANPNCIDQHNETEIDILSYRLLHLVSGTDHKDLYSPVNNYTYSYIRELIQAKKNGIDALENLYREKKLRNQKIVEQSAEDPEADAKFNL